MSSSQPSKIHRTRPWLAERGLRKDSAARMKSLVRLRRVGLYAPVVFLPVIIVTGQDLLLAGPGMAGGAVHAGYVLRDLKKRPENFHAKDAATRALVDDYHAQMAAGTWTGAKRHPLWMVVAPIVALLVGIQLPLLAHTSWALGAAVGLAVFAGIAGYDLVRSRKQATEPAQRMAAAGGV